MSFRFDAFYLIEPRPDLRPQLLGQTDRDFAEMLLDCVLLSNKEGGRTVWTNENHAATVKLLFLARLQEYGPLASDEDAERLLGSSRINVATFDKWWTIRRFVVEENCEELVQFLRAAREKLDRPQNEIVAAWITQVMGSA
jgi:hypothetical protein